MSRKLLLVLPFCLLFFLPIFWAHPYSKAKVIRVKHFANLRKKPKLASPSLTKVPKGAIVEILAKGIPSQDRGKGRKKYPCWYKVRYHGLTGYMAANLLYELAGGQRTIHIYYNPTLDYQEISPTLFAPKELLLTFDDGPRWGVTEKILDILKQYQIRAVFFVNGYAIRASRKGHRESLLEKVYRAGHLIGSHTDRHYTLTMLSKADREKEISNGNLEIRQEFHRFGKSWNPRIFRFPSAAFHHKNGMDLRKEIHKKYKMVIGHPTKIYGKDWIKGQKALSIFHTLKKTTLKEGKGMVVLHELPESVKALKLFIPWALKKGFRFVSLEVHGAQTPPAPSSSIQKIVKYSLKKTKYHTLYYKWGQKYGIDWRLLKAIAIVESSERPNLVNQYGYTGLFQIGNSVLAGFNKRKGTHYSKQNLKNPDINTHIGAWLTYRNLAVLSKPDVFGKAFLQNPENLATAVYCAHNYGIGLVKRTMQDFQKKKLPMTANLVFLYIQKAGEKRYGQKAGDQKMKVAKKVAAIYRELRKVLGRKP
ncbi:MAG: hypothetical protein D6785_13470 [Planctomycetota bacterium]|nr:MAG: hypothetical protein D6785_13470 [Planctomycetota bacterium]